MGSATRSRVLERDSERERERERARARERASKRAREREREREKRELSREGLGFKVLGLGLGFRVWGLGVGVSGLGFGGWGSGFGRERVSERLSVSVPVISLRHKPVFFSCRAARPTGARREFFYYLKPSQVYCNLYMKTIENGFRGKRARTQENRCGVATQAHVEIEPV